MRRCHFDSLESATKTRSQQHSCTTLTVIAIYLVLALSVSGVAMVRSLGIIQYLAVGARCFVSSKRQFEYLCLSKISR